MAVSPSDGHASPAAVASTGAAAPPAGSLAAAGYPAIDGFRIVAALMVVAIHTSPLWSVSETADFVITRVFCRLAVPFFFMASGFFLAPRGDGKAAPDKAALFQRVQRLSGKLLLLYGGCVLLYLPLNLYADYFSQPALPLALLRDLIWDGTFYHLWYFPATVLGAWVAYGLYTHLPPKAALAAAGALYLVGLGGDSYYGLAAALPPLRGFYDMLFTVFSYTRGGLFFAPLFLLLGLLAAGRPPARQPRFYIGGLIVSLDLMLAEALLLRCASAIRHDSMYFALPFAAWFLFALLRRPRGAGHPLLRKTSLLVYVLHPWCIVVVRFSAGWLGATALLVGVSPIFYLLVCAASFAAAFALAKVPPFWRRAQAAGARAAGG